MNLPVDNSIIQVRLSKATEAEAIASILYQAFAEYESAYTPEGFSATVLTPEQIRHRWSEGPVWVTVQDNNIVGTVSAVPQGKDLYIRSLAIPPTARGRGIGRLLLQEIEAFARVEDHRRLVLSTTPFLLRAIRLYEHFGFRRSDEGTKDLFGTPLFTMVKTLEPSGETKSERLMNKETAEHYVWGQGCDGWHLVKSTELSVILERMPAGASEVRHFHRRARQFFFVCPAQPRLSLPARAKFYECMKAWKFRRKFLTKCSTNRTKRLSAWLFPSRRVMATVCVLKAIKCKF